ncbi:DUF6463 family protein [Saccharospirillum impatiens]|uniref:DUF6463 family protein n=1 Tax=Saccharospirillum impatiens TaxID=169438 RepID=UPI0003FE45F4|nr:DUF6463 family protein [Saccharospirillum impatiens]
MKLYKHSGWLLIAIGVLHNTIGVLMGWSILAGIVADGGWNSIETAGLIDFSRSAILWFLVTGFFWMLLGGLMQAWLRVTTEALPKTLGWGLTAAGGIVAFLLPVSGAWLFILLGLLVVYGSPEPAQPAPAAV